MPSQMKEWVGLKRRKCVKLQILNSFHSQIQMKAKTLYHIFEGLILEEQGLNFGPPEMTLIKKINGCGPPEVVLDVLYLISGG